MQKVYGLVKYKPVPCVLYFVTYIFKTAAFLQYHDNRARREEERTDDRFYRNLFMQDHKGEDDRDYDAHLVDGNDLRCVSRLQRAVVAKPRCAGSESRQN